MGILGCLCFLIIYNPTNVSVEYCVYENKTLIVQKTLNPLQSDTVCTEIENWYYFEYKYLIKKGQPIEKNWYKPEYGSKPNPCAIRIKDKLALCLKQTDSINNRIFILHPKYILP